LLSFFRLKMPPIFCLGTLAAHFSKTSHQSPQQNVSLISIRFWVFLRAYCAIIAPFGADSFFSLCL
jgi:hypothetical protein